MLFHSLVTGSAVETNRDESWPDAHRIGGLYVFEDRLRELESPVLHMPLPDVLLQEA
jgi:hypothetical protein